MRALSPALMLLCAACVVPQGPPPPPPPGTLLLSNLGAGDAMVDAVVTANLDCRARADGFVSALRFRLPPAGTRIIDAPPGADVCWRRDRDPPWPGWNRAFLAPGRTVDSTL